LKYDIGKTVAVLEQLKMTDPTLFVALDVDIEGTITCRWGSHGENTHGSRSTSTKN
jgi:hypothetical protein